MAAQPGERASFSIGVRNTGNSLAQYTMNCSSSSQWQIMLGSSNSSSLEFEPLNILQDLSMDVNVFVPNVANGQPAAGFLDQITCLVTSPTDPLLNHVEVVDVAVAELRAFQSDLYGPDGAVGPRALALPISVDTGEVIYFNHTISNNGNVEMDFTVTLERGNPAWAAQMTYLEQSSSSNLALTLAAGQFADIQIMLLVPETAREGNSNTYDLQVEHTSQFFTLNGTSNVSDNLGIELVQENKGIVSGLSQRTSHLWISSQTLEMHWIWNGMESPDGWTVNFANLSVHRCFIFSKCCSCCSSTNQTDVSFEFDLPLFVNGVTMVDSSRLNITSIEVPESEFAVVSTDTTAAPLLFIPRDGAAKQTFAIVNEGNTPLSGTIELKFRIRMGL